MQAYHLIKLNEPVCSVLFFTLQHTPPRHQKQLVFRKLFCDKESKQAHAEFKCVFVKYMINLYRFKEKSGVITRCRSLNYIQYWVFFLAPNFFFPCLIYKICLHLPFLREHFLWSVSRDLNNIQTSRVDQKSHGFKKIGFRFEV